MIRPAVTSLLSLLFMIQVFSQGPGLKFREPALGTDERVDHLVSLLTLEEKASLMLYNSPAIERLGIPAYNWWNECLHGVGRAGRATVFPQAIALAATFDDDLLLRVAEAISDEARAKHNAAREKDNITQYTGLSFWTPNINLFRDPRWGRGQETYGEDPLLTSRMGVAFVKGLQGNHPQYLKTSACAKHFVVHSGPEESRHRFNATPPERDFHESYLPAFRALVGAGVEAVMCAYNRTYNEPCCGSDYLLNRILREEWGFRGHIVSDCWALDDIWQRHKITDTRVEAAAMAARAGVNLNCGYIYKYLPEAVKMGLLSESQIDEILKPLLRSRFRLGLFDPPELNPFNNISDSVVDGHKHRQLAYEAAVKSVVLLQNRGEVLPLDAAGLKNIFVTGPTAANIEALAGNYNGFSESMVTILEGIIGAVDNGTIVDYKLGTPLAGDTVYYGFWEARFADVIVVCLGNSNLLEGEQGEAMLNPDGGDRSTMELPPNQLEFLRRMRKNVVDKPIIAVVTGGSAIALGEVAELADAVLMVWYPGAQGGRAVADILFGQQNPSGRLPVTFYRSDNDLPPFNDYAMKGRTYKYFTGEPLYPFGFGLSYTSFAYAAMKTPDKISIHEESAVVAITITNTGGVAGDEVVQVYGSKVRPGIDDPVQCLLGFERLHLEAGESRFVEIPLNLNYMKAWVEETGEMKLVPGDYILSAGASSTDLRGHAQFRIEDTD